MAFRSSGKSSQMIINHAIWKAVTIPREHRCIVSNTLPQAIELMKGVREVLLASPLLKSMTPSNRSQAWSAKEIELINGSRIIARAYNPNVRGLHLTGIYCLTKEANVLCEEGSKSIADVKVGEKVLTHKNRFRKVLNVYKRKWKGKIYELITESGIKIKLTKGHPVLVKSGKSHTLFKRVEKLKEKDVINIPCTGSSPFIYHPNLIKLDSNLARFMGFYVSEGCYSDGINISCNNKFYDIYLSLMKSIFPKVSVYKNGSIRSLCYFNRRLGKKYKKWFGHRAVNKNIPDFIFRSSRNIQAAFLIGLLDGDGHYEKDHCDWTTISEMLFENVKSLSNKIGLVYHIYNRKKDGSYRLYFPVQSMNQLKMCCFSDRYGGFIQEEIVSLKIKKSYSYVYNIEVEEDNSYTANLLSLHNCDEIGEYGDHEILRKAIMPTIRAKRGQFVGLGTPTSELDLLHAIERDPGFSSIHFDRFPAQGDKGNLFEQRYPDTQILHQDGIIKIIDKKSTNVVETYDNMSWSQEFMLKPLSSADRLFPENIIMECIDENEAFQMYPKNMKQYFGGADFAMSAQSGSDYTVVTVIEKSMDTHKLKIVWMERWKGLDYVVQKQRIKEIVDRYGITKMLGDENSFGKIFIYDLKAEGVPIEGYKFTYQSHSKEELVKALRDQFDKKGFIIPYSNQDTQTYMTIKTLIDELSKFGIIFDAKKGIVQFKGMGTHDDCLISLALANFIARHVSMACFKVIKGSQRVNANSDAFLVAKT